MDENAMGRNYDRHWIDSNLGNSLAQRCKDLLLCGGHVCFVNTGSIYKQSDAVLVVSEFIRFLDCACVVLTLERGKSHTYKVCDQKKSHD